MKTARVTLQSASPYSQSAPINIPKLDKESPDAYEKRCWRERVHINGDGETICIPPMALKNALAECAQYMGEKIPGKRNATWSKHFLAGVMVIDPVAIGIKKADVEGEWLFLDSNGKKNSGTRVWRCYPVIREWSGVAEFHILDDTITEEVFLHHLTEAGRFIGIGRFRPRNGGFYGRFAVKSIEWASA